MRVVDWQVSQVGIGWRVFMNLLTIMLIVIVVVVVLIVVVIIVVVVGEGVGVSNVGGTAVAAECRRLSDCYERCRLTCHEKWSLFVTEWHAQNRHKALISRYLQEYAVAAVVPCMCRVIFLTSPVEKQWLSLFTGWKSRAFSVAWPAGFMTFPSSIHRWDFCRHGRKKLPPHWRDGIARGCNRPEPTRQTPLAFRNRCRQRLCF